MDNTTNLSDIMNQASREVDTWPHWKLGKSKDDPEVSTWQSCDRCASRVKVAIKIGKYAVCSHCQVPVYREKELAAMTESEKTVLVELLTQASNEFSNHGCNDFDLSKFMPNPVEREQLIKEIAVWNGTPDEKIYPMDWLLMSFFAWKLREDS